MSEATDSVGCVLISAPGKGDGEGSKLAAHLLEEAGHKVIRQTTIKDSGLMIKGELAILAESSSCQAIVVVGGTALAARETVLDAIQKLLDKSIPGFGEIFRHLTFTRHGAIAITERALAGIYKGRILLVIPASTEAVRLAMDEMILPELGNMVRQTSRSR